MIKKMNKSLLLAEKLGLEQNWLEDTLNLLPFVVNDIQCHALLRYVALMQQWNNHFNLTAITDSRDMWIKHILDSLSVLPHLQHQHLDGQVYLDVGTGAGLPGIPLAIMQPSWHWRLVDSNAKKIRFLQQVRLMLALPSVEVEHQRTEKLRRDDARVTVICRAYAPPARIAEQVQPWIRAKESICLLQGQALAELIPPDGYATQLYTELSVPYLDASRHLWVIIKTI
jgi:16S rRNA (guanine527-N7)-methyltransferase